jgi:hypothetical protein
MLLVHAARKMRRFSAILALASLVALPPVSARAADDVFEVKGVPVDVKADTAADARRVAHSKGERRAFYGLIHRLTLAEDQERIPELGSDDISSYVLDFSVSEEKASSVRYIARLNYRFKPDQIRGMLRAYGIPFAETRSKPMAILPVMEIGAATVLWDEPNPWRRAWGLRDKPVGLVPIVLPLGDLQDVSTIGAAEAMAGDAARLAAIAQRYGATGTIVAHNNITVPPGSSRQRMTATLHRPSEPYPVESNTITIDQRDGENLEGMMARLVDETQRRIENLWKHRNLILETGTGIMAVTVPIAGLSDWLAVRDQMRSIGIIRNADVVLMSRDQVRVNIHYVGGPDQLVTALEQANLSMLQESGEWLVMPIGAMQPPRT